MPNLTDQALPFEFGRYQVIKVLGEGGMAHVYLAELLGPAGFTKSVALKLVKPGATGTISPEERKSFIGEAKLGGHLRHQNVIDVYEFGEENGQLFISMELVEGIDLLQLTRDLALPPPRPLIQILLGIASGLAHAHNLTIRGEKVGLVHRDIKASNVMLSIDGGVKVADFGISVAKKHDDLGIASNTGECWGTPCYMSPEQLTGAPLDARVDQFALGVLAYLLVTGEKLMGAEGFSGLSKSEGMGSIHPLYAEAEAEIEQVVPGLGVVVRRCLEPRPRRRYRETEDLVEALEGILHRQELVGPTLRTWIRTTLQGGGDEEETRAIKLIHQATAKLEPRPTREVKRSHIHIEDGLFVGRSEELSELHALVKGGARLVTIKAMGGVGKTLLSKHLAIQLEDELIGGAHFVDLSNITEEDALCQSIATGMGLELQQGQAALPALGQALSIRGSTLLVLDNLEQMVGVAAAAIEGLMLAAPEVLFIATSRETLKIDGEAIFPLSPLSSDFAVELFAGRAKKSSPSFTMGPDDRAVVAEIVDRLDRVPLAIELAAARVGMLSLAKLNDRLSDRFKLLRSNKRHVSARQATLDGLIGWSWDLLEPWEKSALGQLAVFRGGFFIGAAEEVLDLSAWPDAPWEMDVLQSLLDKSLIHATSTTDQPLFNMFISLREFATIRLERGGGLAGALRRHAACFERFAEERREDRPSLTVFPVHDDEVMCNAQNLGLAAETALADPELPVPFHTVSLLFAERHRSAGLAAVLSLLSQLIERGGLSQGNRGRVLIMLGLARISSADVDGAIACLEGGPQEVTEPGELGVKGQLHMALAHAYRVAGRLAESTEEVGHALRIFRGLDDPGGIGFCLVGTADLQIFQNKLDGALKTIEEAERMLGEDNAHNRLGRLYGEKGALHQRLGDGARALRCYGRAMALSRQERALLDEAVLHGRVAIVHHGLGDDAACMSSLDRAIKMSREAGQIASLCLQMGNKGELLYLQGAHQEARTCLLESIRWGESISHTYGLDHYLTLAALELDCGDPAQARVVVARASGFVQDEESYQWVHILCTLSVIEAKAGDRAKAQALVDQAQGIIDVHGTPYSLTQSFMDKARAALGS